MRLNMQYFCSQTYRGRNTGPKAETARKKNIFSYRFRFCDLGFRIQVLDFGIFNFLFQDFWVFDLRFCISGLGFGVTDFGSVVLLCKSLFLDFGILDFPFWNPDSRFWISGFILDFEVGNLGLRVLDFISGFPVLSFGCSVLLIELGKDKHEISKGMIPGPTQHTLHQN